MKTHPSPSPYELLQVDKVHRLGIYGAGITVAVLDTGIYPHRDFQNRLLACPDILGHHKTAYDNNGHGTHIAGIIGSAGMVNGHYIGVAPRCNLIGVRILDNSGHGQLSYMLQGIQWILEHRIHYHIRIVNISIGGSKALSAGRDIQLTKAVESLWDAGLVVVVSAGNQGPGKSTVTAPGTSPKVITVGTFDDEKSVHVHGITLRDYSGRGPTRGCVIKPEIVAPGYHIMSCRNAANGYTIKSGTSMSTPFVSGAVALLLEKYPDMTNRDVKLALYQSAVSTGCTKEQQGWGLLNVPALLNHTEI